MVAHPPGRVPALVHQYAPGIATLQIAVDNPVARVAGEILKAAERYVEADPGSIYGAPSERLRLLYVTAGLAARALAL